jgi:hypothetical protein
MRYPLLVAGLVLVPTRALAAQFVVTEVTYEHSATTTTDSHLRLPPSAETPKNWKSPIDYATAGTVWVRLEVFTKPSAENTRFQVCFEATPSYACTDQSPIYTKTGVYTWSTAFPKMYQYSMVDWTKGILKSALILKDDKNIKPAPENVGEARSKLFMPTKLRVTVTVVSPGSTYMPPGTDAGVDAAVDAPADAVSDTIEADLGSDTGSAEDTAVVDTGTTSPVDDAAPSAETGATPDAGTDDGGGCSTSGRPAPVGASLLAIAAVLAARRSKRNPAR